VTGGAEQRAARIDRRLLREARSARTPLVVAVVLGVVTSGLVVAQAILLGRVVARAFLGGQGVADQRDTLIALAVVVVARAACAAGFEASGRLGAGRVMSELRARLTDHILRARPSGLREQRTGDLVTTAVQGVDALEAYFARYLPQVVLAVIVPVVILVYVFPHDLAAGLILLVTVPMIPLFMILIGLAAQSATQKRWKTLSLLSAHFVDVVRGLETLRANDRDGAQAQTLAKAGEAYRTQTMATLRIAFLSSLVLELLAMIGTALVAATVALQLIDGNLTFAVGLSVLLLAPELYLPVRMVGQHFHASTDGLEAAGTLFEVLDTPAAVSEPASPLPAPDVRTGTIELDDVRVAYPGRGAPVLDGLSLRIEPGELVALVGPSGEGKSTLAALLLRLLDPDSGAVRCDGVDLRASAPADWRRQVAWVPQRATLFAGTLEDNVRLGDPGASADALQRALADAGLRELVSTLPDGTQTRIGDGGRTLSAGEAQRVALARAFLRDAPLVVLDEPTAHLDATTAQDVGAAVERLAAGRTTLLIAHHPALAGRADRVLRLASGVLEPVVAGAAS